MLRKLTALVLIATFISGCAVGATLPEKRRNAKIFVSVGAPTLAGGVAMAGCAAARDCSCDHRGWFIAGAAVASITGLVLTWMGGDYLRQDAKRLELRESCRDPRARCFRP